MPSCPAASATAAISSVDAGISVDISRMESVIRANSASDKSVVFATPVIADSKSIDACVHSSNRSFSLPRAADIPAAASALDRTSTASVALSPKDTAPTAVSLNSSRAFWKVARNSRPSCASSANSISYSFFVAIFLTPFCSQWGSGFLLSNIGTRWLLPCPSLCG